MEDIHDDGVYTNCKKKEKPPLWNSFQDPPSKKASGSAAVWTKLSFLLKCLKLLAYVFVFAVIFATVIVAKFSYVFMASNIGGKRSIKYCNLLKPPANTTYVTNLPMEEQIAWLWAIIIAFAAPELLTFFRSLRICIFKGVKSPTWLEVILVISFELLHVIGLASFTVVVLPQLETVKAIMLCNCVSFVPAALNVFTRLNVKWQSMNIVSIFAAIFSLIGQATAFITWPALHKSINIQILAVPLILISFRWWENYINSATVYLKRSMNRCMSRYQTYIYLAPMKIVVFAAVAFALHGQSFTLYFDIFPKMLATHEITVEKLVTDVHNHTTTLKHASTFVIHSNSNAILYTTLLQVSSAYLCYIFSKFACKIKIQEFSLALPLTLVSPMMVAGSWYLSTLHKEDPCIFRNFIPSYLAPVALHSMSLEKIIVKEYLWVWLLWWLSQLLLTLHIWRPKNERNAPTEKLFVCPWYSGFLVDECIGMNRVIIDWKESVTNVVESNCFDVQESDKIPQLIICATMWHETNEELLEFLKSIIRLDEDQCARRMAMTHINMGKPDDEYYELETNIFFDDAFILDEDLCENAKNPPLNEYVKLLIVGIEKAAFEVYGVNIKIRPPVKIETPYGGRLVWTLPGRSKMVAHLKNKDKIRHKKRWSQVMYMYYLLGYRIMELKNVSASRKAVIAENTFLLALDGDIDFQPKAVQLLIDRMKAIDELGAACGRIHPVGRGPLVWYQIFEYAIGHWLQKATEHVIGCVLCSPGCFSLFRGSALMENSVMKKYTTVSQEPMHYIQYDQGEDRWLCTLILKQGLRVEYSAASDAYTHAPEMFNEFFNQRRRWVPSTIANIFDLLSDADMVIKNNNSISMPYISYQAMLMVGTILGPGTIFLMMVGALVAVFGIDIWTSFLWNFVPVLGFILSCIYLKQKFQLLFAFVVSSVYCLVMMAVLIGIIIQIIEDGALAPASLFFLLVFLQIFIAGIVHPQEMTALICGFIYYITIPSMYMLLMIYSVFNMNDVSWGTREVAIRKEGEDAEDGAKNYLPGWMNDPLLVNSELGEITLREKRFWKDLLKLYLKPLYQSKEKKEEISESLRGLRNMFSFAFMMINSLFVLIVFLLQLKKDYLHLEWPFDPLDVITYDDLNSQIYIYRRYKELDPIGMCFVVFFGLILIIQFIAMFFHRFATFSQLLATSTLDWFRSTNKLTDEEAAQEISGNAVNIAKQLQRPKRIDEDDDSPSNDPLGDDAENKTRRQTVFKLHENRNKNQQDYSDLPRNFEKRFFGEDDIEMKHISMSRKSMMILNENRIGAKKRLTQQQRVS